MFSPTREVSLSPAMPTASPAASMLQRSFSPSSRDVDTGCLFAQAVDAFGYIQLARDFSIDYERCQLRLDVERRRLVKWGIAIDVQGDPRFNKEDEKFVRGTIQAIIDQFQRAQGMSSRYKQNISPKEQKALVIFEPERDLSEPARKGHRKFSELCGNAIAKTGHEVARRAYWAIYDGKSLETLVTSIQDDISALVELAPATPKFETKMAELTAGDATELDKLGCLREVAQAAVGVDNDLAAILKAKLQPSRHDQYKPWQGSGT
ncbi:hypothetical protein CHGG_03533 [Chaetomium globosum CBS 148.51]|uniref:Prion-inhibition and propagation HeLo domain-containing protein n=1 Tax=Chaetomium globosum (strain ATCC 6205 / CBS 148.51 / DSM 1962 / NBRC 6347 / NRRL 1970) TaxID=306901 RepID=Q2H8C1_CHAGB|nr:uncharacterized protein CHGG_03533 [Chaetomium globosum CBS 148.51]EAQ91598.1 hypothetical protein CHGG_03533 [Chaetomium globosum CBS 148.51]